MPLKRISEKLKSPPPPGPLPWRLAHKRALWVQSNATKWSPSLSRLPSAWVHFHCNPELHSAAAEHLGSQLETLTLRPKPLCCPLNGMFGSHCYKWHVAEVELPQASFGHKERSVSCFILTPRHVHCKYCYIAYGFLETYERLLQPNDFDPEILEAFHSCQYVFFAVEVGLLLRQWQMYLDHLMKIVYHSHSQRTAFLITKLCVWPFNNI